MRASACIYTIKNKHGARASSASASLRLAASDREVGTERPKVVSTHRAERGNKVPAGQTPPEGRSVKPEGLTTRPEGPQAPKGPTKPEGLQNAPLSTS